MKNRIKFLSRSIKARLEDEEGAVSVDWVVLTAAIVGVAAGTASTISGAISTLGGSVGTELTDKTVENGD
ncbi:MAG: hypothetical protein RIG84_07005 [Roseovarius sp.]